jgi:hypothetical protein
MFSVRVPLELTDAACAIRPFLDVGDTREATAPRQFRGSDKVLGRQT